jgi:hypothetical protein
VMRAEPWFDRWEEVLKRQLVGLDHIITRMLIRGFESILGLSDDVLARQSQAVRQRPRSGRPD